MHNEAIRTVRRDEAGDSSRTRCHQSCLFRAAGSDEGAPVGHGVALRRACFLPGGMLYRRGSPFTSLYQVCRGSVKTQRTTVDGSLVVGGFYLPGDVVGFDALNGSEYINDAIATSHTVVCQLDFGQFSLARLNNLDIGPWIIRQMGDYIRRRDREFAWCASLPSYRRILLFFVDLCERLGDEVRSAPLPMRKQDIARYLHMAPESFSRGLAQLRRRDLLYVERDHFSIPDTESAQQLTEF